MSSQHPAGQSDARATLLAALVEDANDAIVSIDPAGTITSWNNGAQRLLGHTEAEMLGKPMLIIVTAERHAAELEIFARAHRGEPVDHHETRLQHRDGSFVALAVAVSPIRNAPGEIIGAAMIARPPSLPTQIPADADTGRA
jgi:two-component system CheB/CheR fusion protein